MTKIAFSCAGAMFTYASEAGRSVLFEHEIYYILEQAGIAVPRHAFIKPGENLEVRLEKFPRNTRFALKVVSPYIVHKTEAGGVKLGLEIDKIESTVKEMRDTVPATYADWLLEHTDQIPDRYAGCSGRDDLIENIRKDIAGFLAIEMIDFPRQFGSEIIIGAKNDEAFGPSIMVGPGGLQSEFFTRSLKDGLSHTLIPVISSTGELIAKEIEKLAVIQSMQGEIRGSKKLCGIEHISKITTLFHGLMQEFSLLNENAKWHIEEFEINPLAVSFNQVFPLDGFMRFREAGSVVTARPVQKIKNLLSPNSVGVVGISASKPSPAGAILQNLREGGVEKDDVFIVHPRETVISECSCYSSIEALKESLSGRKIDIFVVGIPAQGPEGQTAGDFIATLVAADIAESVLIISAGFDEVKGGEGAADKVKEAFQASRVLESGGTVGSGPNTLGNLYYTKDTRFTPQYKSGAINSKGAENVALICQSGAFMITRISNLAGAINPRIASSVGNQIDLTLGDFLEVIVQEETIDVVAVYVEGFKPGDGARFCRLSKAASEAGKQLIVYKAGRTSEGRNATQGHTASLAGDYDLAKKSLESSGCYVAESFEDFQNMIIAASLLHGKAGNISGIPRMAALSNAGFEKCAIGDNLELNGETLLEIADYSDQTKDKLNNIFELSGLSKIIDIDRILDITPMANDKLYEDIVRVIVEDENVDCALISIVPETGMLQTLNTDGESFDEESSLPSALIRLNDEVNKPIIVVVESGDLYKPYADFLQSRGVPVFRSVDTAVKIFGKYLQIITNSL